RHPARYPRGARRVREIDPGQLVLAGEEVEIAAQLQVRERVSETARDAGPGPGFGANDLLAGQMSRGRGEPGEREAFPLILLAPGHVTAARAGEAHGRGAIGLQCEHHSVFPAPLVDRAGELLLRQLSRRP